MKPELYWIELNDKENLNEYLQYLHYLDEEKKKRILKFSHETDQKLSLLSDLFARYLACKKLNVANNELTFDKGPHGKPFLTGFSHFHYNLSHTRNAIAIGCGNKPMGIDIEKIKAAKLKIARRFFTKNEQNYILSNEADGDRLFYQIWTKKEAYIKWVGKGMSLSLNSFDVTDTTLQSLFETVEINGYIISVCSEETFINREILKIQEEDLLDFLPELVSVLEKSKTGMVSGKM